jgi:hypothetical protein
MTTAGLRAYDIGMSERGSFVTEYIYCDKCFAAAKGVLLANDKYLRSVVVPQWGDKGGELKIIAGKVGGLYAGEELVEFEYQLIPALEQVICHPLRVAVLAERGERIFTAMPSEVGVKA